MLSYYYFFFPRWPKMNVLFHSIHLEGGKGVARVGSRKVDRIRNRPWQSIWHGNIYRREQFKFCVLWQMNGKGFWPDTGVIAQEQEDNNNKKHLCLKYFCEKCRFFHSVGLQLNSLEHIFVMQLGMNVVINLMRIAWKYKELVTSTWVWYFILQTQKHNKKFNFLLHLINSA